VPLAAWSGPEGSSLVIYRGLPIPGGTAATIALALSTRLENLPGVQVVERRIEQLGGVAAARVEIVAPGSGDALAPSGAGTPVAPEGTSLVPTREITLGFVRPGDTVYLTWHHPESSRDRIGPEISATIDSLRLASSWKATSYSDSD